MKILLPFRQFLRFFKQTLIFIIIIIVIYAVTALILSVLKTHPPKLNCSAEIEIFITTNGIHLDIVLPIENIESSFLKKLEILPGTKYVAFGWGDKKFYTNTPEWKDLTFSTAFTALFLKSKTAMHVTCYSQKYKTWKLVRICPKQADILNIYIYDSFLQTENGELKKIEVPGYYSSDFFFEAKGFFSLFKTCNTWVNRALKEIGVETSVWSPFDFGILYHLPN
jgi:uncharacterized protein (TIGR02117 family)